MTDSLTSKQELLKALKYLARHYVGTMEHARNRIIDLGGSCDPVDVMERGDPHLRVVREVIAQAERAADEPRECIHPFARLGVDADGVMWCVECLTKPLVIPVPFGDPEPPTEDLELMRKDAARYEWLREHWSGVVTTQEPGDGSSRGMWAVTLIETMKTFRSTDPQTLDHAIDAAMDREDGASETKNDCNCAPGQEDTCQVVQCKRQRLQVETSVCTCGRAIPPLTKRWQHDRACPQYQDWVDDR